MNRFLLLFFVLQLFSATGFGQKATVSFQIIDMASGRLTPARLTVLKAGRPLSLEVPSQLHLASRENTIYTASGSGTFTLAPGKYEFWFGKGMEYSVDVHRVEVKAKENYFINAKLDKELNTDGFVSGDLHLHTFTNSGHGDANLIERVISCTAEGLDWAVATDHNFITDYQPYLLQAGLKGMMSTTVGNEVSTSVGHFNTYPLPAESEAINSKPVDLNLLFDSIRLESGKEVVIQVNHPRWIASDYFNTKGLDIYFGTVKHPEWSWDFDAIEVLNENYQLGWKTAPDNLQSVKRDWFNLLNHNRRITGLGNSDSHDVVKAIAGVPRNYILSSTDIPAEINEKELAANIKAQRVSVACGIFTKIMVKGKNAMGETFHKGKSGIPLQLQVQAPSWVDCTKAELIRNGVVLKTFDLNRTKSAIRLDTTVTVTPQKDSWYLLIAYGEKAMYPMVGTKARPVYPLGFTNPVWIDADKKGKFVSLFDQAAALVKKQADNVEEFTKAVQEKQELIPYVFYHLFEKKHPNALEISKPFFRNGTTEQRRMLFRELAKTDMEGAEELLKAFQKGRLTPLEEIVLASYIRFPIRNSRVENFKARQNSQLAEQLNYLETQLTYFHSGAIEQRLERGFNLNGDLKSLWEYTTADENGFHHFPQRPSGHFLLKSNWKMRKDTSLYFYLRSDQKCYLYVNGEKKKVFPPTFRLPIEKQLFSIPLKKGNNEIILQIPTQTPSKFCFHQAGESMLLDPTKKIREVKHTAVDKPVEYLTKYHYKYHGFGNALTDGFRGEANFGDQLWQGWEGENAEFIVDLGETITIEEIQLGILSNPGSWIFLPKKVSFQVAGESKDWETVFEQEFSSPKQETSPQISDAGGKMKPVQGRYIRVIAEKIKAIPEWHQAKGEKAWIFLDELIVR